MALGLTGFKSNPNSLQVDTSSGAMSSVNSTAISNPLPRISLILGRESVAFSSKSFRYSPLFLAAFSILLSTAYFTAAYAAAVVSTLPPNVDP